MKKSELKELIKNILQEQGAGPRPSMPNFHKSKRRKMKPPQGTSKKPPGGSYMCICADGTKCPGTFRPQDGAWDCSCCPK